MYFRPRFRSYKPQDEALQEAKLEDGEPAVVEEEVRDLLEAGKEKVLNALIRKSYFTPVPI